MTPKEKAEALVEEYNEILGQHIFNGHFDISQQCALIAVDEIINSSPSTPILSNAGSFVNDIEESTEWWKEVKNEINKL